MEKAKLSVVHFEEDVIATSGCTHDLYYLSGFSSDPLGGTTCSLYICNLQENGTYKKSSSQYPLSARSADVFSAWKAYEGCYLSTNADDENCAFGGGSVTLTYNTTKYYVVDSAHISQ